MVCEKTCIFCFFPNINKYFLMAKRSLLSRSPLFIESYLVCVHSTVRSESYNAQCTVHTPNRTGYTSYMQPHCRNVFKRRGSVYYLNDYNFSEVKMPHSLMMFLKTKHIGAFSCSM